MKINSDFLFRFSWLLAVLVFCANSLRAQDTVVSISDTVSAIASQEIKEDASENAFVYRDGIFVFTHNGLIREIPAWYSILPPLIAILMAFIIREVLVSLFTGIFAGAFILYGFSLKGMLLAFFSVFDKYIVEAINDSGHISVIVFSMLIGGMVAVISRNGGMAGIVRSLSKYANTPVMGQAVTWFMGVVIFFDDYANTLVVGNTMRAVSDKLKISREKLSYLVDSTAAPVASIAFITTWIGVELGFIQQAIETLNSDPSTINLSESAYSVFINSLQFSFYPILTLLFMLMIILMKRDFGPMFKAENRARTTGVVVNPAFGNSSGEQHLLNALDPLEGVKQRGFNALIPVAVLIITMISALFISGYNPEVWNDLSKSFALRLSETIGNADSYKALLWASAAGVTVALILSISQKIMSIGRGLETLMNGFRTMLPAIGVLILAWGLGNITKDLHTADFLSAVLSDKISPYWIAEITFLLAAVISFATGTSWGTMTILYPIALPLSWAICHHAGLPEEEIMRIFYNVVSVVLAGAVFGDHCSPISDTTILSSLATSCPHLDHVKTQIPYAITVAVVSMLVCTKLADFGFAWYVTYPAGALILYLIVRIFGKKIPDAALNGL